LYLSAILFFVLNSEMNKILLIHPDMVVRDNLTFVLQHSGFHVVSAIEGQQALAQIDRCHPDLIIMAEEPGRLNVNELCIDIRQVCHIPVIILGRDKEEAAGIDLLEMGADAYLTYPLNLRELLARIHSLLRCQAGKAGDRSHSIRESGVLHQEGTKYSS